MSIIAIASENVVIDNHVQPATIIYSAVSGKIIHTVVGTILDPSHSDLVHYDVAEYKIVSPLVVMPGLVDAHVHLNEPGRTEWEGFETGTKSAASGGVTTVIDMPLNAIPPTTTVANLNLKLDAARNKLWCDVGFWGGLVPSNLKDLVPLVKAGVRGFKGFLIDSGVEEFPAIDAKYIDAAMKTVHGLPTMLMFHAEMQSHVDIGPVVPCGPNHGCDSQLGDPHSPGSALGSAQPNAVNDPLQNIDPTAYNSFLLSRPDSFETDAIKTIIRCLEKNPDSVPLHIVHLASQDGVPLLQQAQSKGLNITAETCFHYLSLAAENIPNCSTFFKCCPPIRSDDNRHQLWKALRDGVITTVVSDHSPCTPELKNLEKGDFMSAWGGIASVGLGLPILYTEGLKQNPPVTMVEIVQWTCVNTAKQVGLDRVKGKLAPGYDADIVVFDPKAVQTIANESTHFKNKLTAYNGLTLRGVVKRTILRGKVVFDSSTGHSAEALGKPLLEPRTL